MSEFAQQKTILIVDDEELARHMAIKIVSRQGYNYLQAENGSQALEAIKSQNTPIHLLFTDINMPNMNGFELAEHAREMIPGLKVLYTSGNTAYSDVLQDNTSDIGFLGKPYGVPDLVAAIELLL